MEAIPRPASQPLDVFCVRTMELILSVIVANECPGAMYAACCSGPLGGMVVVSGIRWFPPEASSQSPVVSRQEKHLLTIVSWPFWLRAAYFSSPSLCSPPSPPSAGFTFFNAAR